MCSFCCSWLRWTMMVSECLSMPGSREADVLGDHVEFQPQLRLPGCLGLWCPPVRVSLRLLIGFEMETISSKAEVVLCGWILSQSLHSFCCVIGSSKRGCTSSELNVCLLYFWQSEFQDSESPFPFIKQPESSVAIFEISTDFLVGKRWGTLQAPQLVIKIAGQCNLFCVQWLESMEAVRQR